MRKVNFILQIISKQLAHKKPFISFQQRDSSNVKAEPVMLAWRTFYFIDHTYNSTSMKYEFDSNELILS